MKVTIMTYNSNFQQDSACYSRPVYSSCLAVVQLLYGYYPALARILVRRRRGFGHLGEALIMPLSLFLISSLTAYRGRSLASKHD